MKEAIQYLSERDPKLIPLFEAVSISAVDVHNDLYLDLLNAIVSQQLSTKAAATIFDRFLQLFDNLDPTPQYILNMENETLRSCGLSNQKATYIKNIAAYWIENKADKCDWLKMPDDDIIKELTTIKGVGKWTVQMILMFRLNRSDIFPIDDLGIRQAMIQVYGITSVGKTQLADLEKIAAVWRPYRTVACRYLWRWRDTQKR